MTNMTSTKDALNIIKKKTTDFLNHNKLTLLFVPLPLANPSTRDTVIEKTRKNRSWLISELNPKTSISEHNKALGFNEVSESWTAGKAFQPSKDVSAIDELSERLADNASCGFVMIVAEIVETKNVLTGDRRGTEYHPIAGGVVEVEDTRERSITATWCRRSVKTAVAVPLMRCVVMRLFVEALIAPFVHDGVERHTSQGMITILHKAMMGFPVDVSHFLTSHLFVGMTPHANKSKSTAHTDCPVSMCRCRKTQQQEDVDFWGISESRLIHKICEAAQALVPHVEVLPQFGADTPEMLTPRESEDETMTD